MSDCFWEGFVFTEERCGDSNGGELGGNEHRIVLTEHPDWGFYFDVGELNPGEFNWEWGVCYLNPITTSRGHTINRIYFGYYNGGYRQPDATVTLKISQNVPVPATIQMVVPAVGTLSIPFVGYENVGGSMMAIYQYKIPPFDPEPWPSFIEAKQTLFSYVGAMFPDGEEGLQELTVIQIIEVGEVLPPESQSFGFVAGDKDYGVEGYSVGVETQSLSEEDNFGSVIIDSDRTIGRIRSVTWNFMVNPENTEQTAYVFVVVGDEAPPEIASGSFQEVSLEIQMSSSPFPETITIPAMEFQTYGQSFSAAIEITESYFNGNKPQVGDVVTVIPTINYGLILQP